MDEIPLLAARSHYSLMDGARSPEALCDFALSSGYACLSSMDASNLYALPAFADAAEERGLKLLAGASFERPGALPLYAWALDRGGFGRLCALISAEKAAPPTGFLAVAQELCAGGWAGLALATADGALAQTLMAALERAEGARGELYLALNPALPMAGPARLARRLGLRPLAVCGGRAYGEGDAELLRLLAAIRRRITLTGLAGMTGWTDPAVEPSVPDAARAAALFSAYPEAVAAAAALAAAAAPAKSFFSSPPVFPAWQGSDDGEAFRALRAACAEGAARRYAPLGMARADVSLRLDKELAIIRDKGFSSYFLVVRDIVALCPRTCGRGSAASSIVSYLLGLTHVDPLAHELFFERFLNEGRVDPPDIDIDFPWDERAGVLDAVFERYKGGAAMVADHCRFSGASRVREAALALGMNPDDIDRYVALWRREGGAALPEGLAAASMLLKNVPRYLGTHPGGVVVVPGAITDYAPVQPGLAGHPVLAWEKDGTERAGLVKIDILGNRSLAVLRDCIELCSREPDAPPEASSWEGFNPVDEASARSLIESGSTIGIFYIESPATRQLLAKMRRADYAHLVAASSIIRPAANRYINEYVRRLRGQAWKRLPESVEACLRDTYGIMVYQEDVSRVAMAAAGFSAVEADQLRKTLTKKRGSARLLAFKERFLEGCAERRVPAADAGELWSMMLSFDGYSFCKAHSASYALVSYRLAWMKARRPAYFIASVINNGGGFYGIQTYVDEARRLGCQALTPLVNKSGLRYALEREADQAGQPAGLGASEPRLRAGLLQVKGLSAAGAQAIVAARERGGAFTSALDFLSRVKSPYDEYRALARSGCLDGLALSRPDGEPATRPALLWAYHHWRGGAAAPAGELFPSACAPPCIRDYTAGRKLADEAEFLGVILSAYPPELFCRRADSAAARLAWPARLKSDALHQAVGRRICMLGLAVAGKEVVTSEGKPMCFRSFSDEAGVYECVLFPQAYKRLMPILEGNGAFLVLGVAREEYGALALHVEDAVSLNKSSRGAR